MAKMASLHAEGVTDLPSFLLGIQTERERVIAILKDQGIIADVDAVIEYIQGDEVTE